jgi:DNA (cytosine-5)-methyltransferase 3A
MKKEYQDVISGYMGVSPIMINSSLLSAQNRVRFYWTNIPKLSQPEDKGILLKDIIIDETDEKYYLTAKAIDYMCRLRNGKPRWEYHKNPLDGKAACLTANMYKGVPYGVLRIPEATKKGYTELNPNEGVDLTFINSKTRRGRLMKEKSNCLTATNYDYCWYDGYICRKLTPVECERLQTFPDNYTDGVSNSQRYKALGNSWTVDVIAHIFNGLNNEGA